MVSKGQFLGLDWNRIARLHSHRVSSNSVVRASDLIMEGRGFSSHLGLGIFSEFFFSPYTLHLIFFYTVNHLKEHCQLHFSFKLKCYWTPSNKQQMTGN